MLDKIHRTDKIIVIVIILVFTVLFMFRSETDHEATQDAVDRAEHLNLHDDLKRSLRRLPDDAELIEDLGNNWIIFELKSQCFLYYPWGKHSVLTNIDCPKIQKPIKT